MRWPIPAALGIAPLVLGILVTLNQDHSVGLGFGVVGIEALATALASVLLVATAPRGAGRIGAIVKVVWGVVLGGLAIWAVMDLAQHDDARNAFDLELAAAATLGGLGVIDLVVGVRERRRDRFGRDWITLGVVELVIAVAVVLVPADYDYRYTVTDPTLPPAHLDLDAAVIVVGLLGAGLAIIGVYLAIAAVSLVSGRKKEQVAA